MRRGLVAGFAVMTAACASDSVSSPVESPIAASASVRAATQGAIADLTSRIIPASERLLASAELRDALSAANSAIERSNAKALTAALERADRAVDRLANAEGLDGAELDAIRLALADARRLIDPQ